MAVVVEEKDVVRFLELAESENLEATVVATVKADARLTMTWNGVQIVDISREFLNSNGADKHIDISVAKAQCYKKEISGSFAENMEKLADDLAKNPLPPNQFLVITAPKLLKTSLLAKKMKAIAETVEYAVPERSKDRFGAALARVNELAQEENLKFAPGADRAFVAKAGCDTRTLVSELEKMRTYLGEETREVTLDDINNVTSPGGGDIEIWALTEAMASRSAAKTLAVLKNFQGDSGWPVMISTIVERWFRDLIIAKAGGGGDDWKARKNAEAARSFSLTELRLARLRMIRLREKLVSSSPGDDYVELEILRTLSRRQ
jgi:DNA polymerase III delta subunit